MTLKTRLRRLLRRDPCVHVLRLGGVIARGAGLSDHGTAAVIEAAFARRPAAVALAVNSPGGAPVQSALIAARIRRLADKHEVPVIAFCEDVAASGGYWIACAADEIYADASSLVGSVGVISAGFGVHDLIARYGIERRVHATGPRKMILDPFQPEKTEDLADLADIHADILAAFVAHVRERRGPRLTDPKVFDGGVYTGVKAEAAGLIDGIGHLAPVMTEKLGEAVHFRDFSPRRGLLRRVGLGFGAAGLEAVGAGAVDAGAAGLEARLLWARYGL